MRTIAHVDGYNLYHGRLKRTAYKWLDLRALLADILKTQDPSAELVGVRFYTSMIKGALASRGQASVIAQDDYHRAIQLKGVDVVLGKFILEPTQAPVRIAGKSADRSNRVDIWSLGEKETDVRLALGIYRDVAAGNCDQVMLVTNDSDLSPALQAVRDDYPKTQIGVVLPRRPKLTERASGSLSKLADWTRHHILDEELARAQMPSRVPTKKKAVDKPGHW